MAGLAAVLTAAAGLVAAVTALVSVLRNGKTARDTHGMVKQIDSAVNGKPPGGTTMVSQVQEMHDQAFPAPVENGDAVLPTLRRLEQLLTESLAQ